MRLVHPAEKASRVTTCRRHSWSRGFACKLLPAVLLAISLGYARDAEAVLVSSAPGFDAHEHSLHCDCGDKCKRKACCCGPEAAKPRPASTASTDAGPCLNSAPCGDPILPNAPPAGPGAKSATLVMGGREMLVAASRLLPSSAHFILPPRRSSRLDDPPERPDVA